MLLAPEFKFLVVVIVCRHLVPLTDLKPVNPVPAWNVAAPVRKGELGKLEVLKVFGYFPTHPGLLTSSSLY